MARASQRAPRLPEGPVVSALPRSEPASSCLTQRSEILARRESVLTGPIGSKGRGERLRVGTQLGMRNV